MSKITYTVPSHVELTIRRPGGNIETVIMTKPVRRITDREFSEIKAATAKAGRGEVVGYVNVTTEHVESDADYAERIALESADRDYASSKRMERMMAYGERDECAHHGSRREPSHKAD